MVDVATTSYDCSGFCGNNAEGLLPLEIKNLPSVGGLSGGTIAGLATCDKGFFPFSSLRVCGDYDQYEINGGGGRLSLRGGASVELQGVFVAMKQKSIIA